MNRSTLDRETRKHLRDEAEWLLWQEQRAIGQIELVIIRLGYGEQAPRYIQSPSTEHSVILTKRVVVYDPYTGSKRFGARLLGLTVLPAMALAWVVDSLIYGFTRKEGYGQIISPRVMWDLVKYPGKFFSLRETNRNTRKGGGRYGRKY